MSSFPDEEGLGNEAERFKRLVNPEYLSAQASFTGIPEMPLLSFFKLLGCVDPQRAVKMRD